MGLDRNALFVMLVMDFMKPADLLEVCDSTTSLPAVNNHATPCELGQSQVPDPFVGTGSVAHTLDARVGGDELLLMSHSLLFWFHPVKRSTRVLLYRQDWRFRGVFRSDTDSLVALATPDLTEESVFVRVSTTGEVLGVEPASGTLDGHEMVRYGELVFVASTRTGAVNVYNARTLKPVRSHGILGDCRMCHVNGMAIGPSMMYVMLHYRPTTI